MNRKLILACGLSVTGKSHWCRVIMKIFKADQPQFFDIDEVRERTWGERARSLTREEHLFKNQLTRQEVQRAFVLGAKMVVLNMVMPTKEHHQKPFIAMIQETEGILSRIKKENEQPTDPSGEAEVKIDIRAIWFDCNETCAAQRLRQRQICPSSSQSDLVQIEDWRKNRNWFEPPDGEFYSFIRIDTYNESLEADEERFKLIYNFVNVNF